MSITAQPESLPGCLSTNGCLRFVEGGPDSPPAEQVYRHMDDCDRCRALVAEAVRTNVGGRASGFGPVFRVLADGERVGDRYTIQRFVARGGMGEVYEAEDTMLGGRVALKTFAVTAADQVEAAESLLREVRIARKVIHPNVCRILELGIHRRTEAPSEAIPFLTMDFLDGETLAQRIAHGPPLDVRQVARLMRGMAAGLGAVHRAGIVHRDFKSDNVFLVRRQDGEVHPVVMDFGLARLFDGSSVSRSSNAQRLVGTAAYMAPEQLRGLPTTAATDVFALGIVSFEMITGRLPFTGDSLAAVALARLHQPAPLPSSLRRELDPRWDQLLGRCLEREPARRFASVDDVAAATEALDGDGDGDLGAPRLRLGSRWWLVSGGATVAIAVLVASWRSCSPTAVMPTNRSRAGASASHAAVVGPQSTPATALPSPIPDAGAVAGGADRAVTNPRPKRATMLKRARAPAPSLPAARPSAEILTAPAQSAADSDPLKPAGVRPRHPDDLAYPF